MKYSKINAILLLLFTIFVCAIFVYSKVKNDPNYKIYFNSKLLDWDACGNNIIAALSDNCLIVMDENGNEINTIKTSTSDLDEIDLIQNSEYFCYKINRYTDAPSSNWKLSQLWLNSQMGAKSSIKIGNYKTGEIIAEYDYNGYCIDYYYSYRSDKIYLIRSYNNRVFVEIYDIVNNQSYLVDSTTDFLYGIVIDSAYVYTQSNNYIYQYQIDNSYTLLLKTKYHRINDIRSRFRYITYVNGMKIENYVTGNSNLTLGNIVTVENKRLVTLWTSLSAASSDQFPRQINHIAGSKLFLNGGNIFAIYNLENDSIGVFDVNKSLGVNKIFDGNMLNDSICIARPGENHMPEYLGGSLENYLIIFNYYKCKELDTVFNFDGRIAYTIESD